MLSWREFLPLMTLFARYQTPIILYLQFCKLDGIRFVQINFVWISSDACSRTSSISIYFYFYFCVCCMLWAVCVLSRHSRWLNCVLVTNEHKWLQLLQRRHTIFPFGSRAQCVCSLCIANAITLAPINDINEHLMLVDRELIVDFKWIHHYFLHITPSVYTVHLFAFLPYRRR